MGWLTLLRLLLSITDKVAGYIREQNLLNAGEARATARAMAEISRRLDISDQITAEIEAMTAEQRADAWEKEP